jgi:hypothetical protein
MAAQSISPARTPQELLQRIRDQHPRWSKERVNTEFRKAIEREPVLKRMLVDEVTTEWAIEAGLRRHDA